MASTLNGSAPRPVGTAPKGTATTMKPTGNAHMKIKGTQTASSASATQPIANTVHAGRRSG